MTLSIRTMRQSDYEQVTELIYDSTNEWYLAQNRGQIFTGPKSNASIFCRVYETLDPGCCLVAVDDKANRIAGSCFYHPRETHYSLGIMNVHPDYFGMGVASMLLRKIIDKCEQAALPLRLVSSAVNLDSYSLYNRYGFVPQTIYQDMIITVPEAGLTDPPDNISNIRTATKDDINEMADLEMRVHGLGREKDIRYFIENHDHIWHTLIHEDNNEITGWLVSVNDPGSCMVGPGVMTNEQTAINLIYAQLDHLRGKTPVTLIPATCRQMIDAMYHWGAKNCELHFTQVRGKTYQIDGIALPTFMPETA